MSFWKWSRTAADNATADASCPFPEGMNPGALNDGTRAMMAAAAKYRDDVSGAIVTGGSSTAYTLASYQQFDTLDHLVGAEIAFQLHAECGTPVTLNVDGRGAKPLRSASGVELVAGALKSGSVHRATYAASNSGEWLLHSVNPTIIVADQVVTSSIIDKAVTLRKMGSPSNAARILGSNRIAAKAITGAANNGSGLIRLTVGDTTGYSTGQKKSVFDVLGTTEANGTWTITVVDGTHIDLQGSTFSNVYTSGGTIGAGVEELTLSEVLDFVGSAARGDILVRGASAWQRVAVGAAGQVLKSDGTDAAYGTPALPLLHVREEQSSGVSGASATTSSAWVQRVINTTKTNEITSASVGSNQITLPAGTYFIEGDVIIRAGAIDYKTSVRLQDITNTATLIQGIGAYMSTGGSQNTTVVALNNRNRLSGRFTLAGTTTIQVQHWTDRGTGGGQSLGISGATEVYLDVVISKIG